MLLITSLTSLNASVYVLDLFKCSFLRPLFCAGVAKRFVSSVSADGTPLFFQPPIYNLLRLITVGDHGPASAGQVHRPTTYKVGGSGPPASKAETAASKHSKVSLVTDAELKKTLKVRSP